MTAKQVSFDTLPEEIMENIIAYCDGISLGNLLKTSKRWKQCIEEPKKYILRKWGLVCSHEMKPDFIIDVLQNLYPKYWLDDEVCWKSVYSCWMQWNHLKHWKPSIQILDKKTKNGISHIKFSGNWVFITTKNEGVLEAINYVTREKVLLHQCNSVHDMYLRCYVSKKDTKDTILDDLAHDEVVMVIWYHYVCFDLHTGQATLRPKLRGFLTLKHFEGQEVFVANGNTPSSICNLNVITKKKTITQRKEFSSTNIIQVWNGHILLLDCDERWIGEGVLDVTDYNFIPVDHPLSNRKLNWKRYMDMPMSHYHLGVSIAVSGVEMEISVNGKIRKYKTCPDLNCFVMSTFYYAGVLFLGSDIGTIYTFRVNSDDGLLKLNLSEYDCCLDISSHSIIALDVKETSAKPMIAAATEYEIHIIRFD